MKFFLKLAVLIFIVGAGFAGYKFLKGPQIPVYETFTVVRSSVTQDVTLTGKAQSTESVDLSFETGGKVKTITKNIGDRVLIGDSIISLDASESILELAEAQAQLDVELSALRELKKGTRPEEVLVYETKLSNARVDASSAMSALADKLRESFTKADDAIRNNTDQFFSNPRSASPSINITVSDGQLKGNIESGRVVVEKSLVSLLGLAGSVSSNNSTALLSDSQEVIILVNVIKNFLNNVALAVNALSSSSLVNQTTVDAYKASVSSARASVNTSVSAILTAEDKARATLSAVTLAEKELALKKAGATTEQVASQTAKIKQSEAKIARLKLLIEKMILRSPISGVVTKQEAKVGGVVSAQTILVSIISDDSLLIEANIPEVDIGRVVVGNPVKITVDAFPGEDFQGTVSYIDPAETVVDGVVNFKSKIKIENTDLRLKSGLTANLEIQTAEKKNVLVVPQLAVLETNQGAFVQKLQGTTLVEIKVTLGVRDRSGNVEIVSGLNEGDKVVNVGLR